MVCQLTVLTKSTSCYTWAVLQDNREFLVQWRGLSIAESSWEKESALADYRMQIDSFLAATLPKQFYTEVCHPLSGVMHWKSGLSGILVQGSNWTISWFCYSVCRRKADCRLIQDQHLRLMFVLCECWCLCVYDLSYSSFACRLIHHFIWKESQTQVLMRTTMKTGSQMWTWRTSPLVKMVLMPALDLMHRPWTRCPLRYILVPYSIAWHRLCYLRTFGAKRAFLLT